MFWIKLGFQNTVHKVTEYVTISYTKIDWIVTFNLQWKRNLSTFYALIHVTSMKYDKNQEFMNIYEIGSDLLLPLK